MAVPKKKIVTRGSRSTPRPKGVARYSVSLITQGKNKFYTLTIPSDVLARCCFATTRDEDPQKGFQRVLDTKRAEAIAKYIDDEGGTIPSSVVLSAQRESAFEIVDGGKTAQFKISPKSFLILDGQHRIYGFSKAESSLRVPVVVYSELSREQEARLFIDINSKQKGVPNELLLDIKRLADIENSSEEYLRDIFDELHSDTGSPLFDLLTPAKSAKKKISRVTFNAAIKPLLPIFEDKDPDYVAHILGAYFTVIKYELEKIECADQMTNATVFKAFSSFFPSVAAKLKDRFGPEYTVANFETIVGNTISASRAEKFRAPGNSFNTLSDYLESRFKSGFTL